MDCSKKDPHPTQKKFPPSKKGGEGEGVIFNFLSGWGMDLFWNNQII